MRQLSGFDALFVYDDGPRETQHTIKVCLLSEEASRAYDFESAKAHVGTRLVMMPPLRWQTAAPLSVLFEHAMFAQPTELRSRREDRTGHRRSDAAHGIAARPGKAVLPGRAGAVARHFRPHAPAAGSDAARAPAPARGARPCPQAGVPGDAVARLRRLPHTGPRVLLHDGASGAGAGNRQDLRRHHQRRGARGHGRRPAQLPARARGIAGRAARG